MWCRGIIVAVLSAALAVNVEGSLHVVSSSRVLNTIPRGGGGLGKKAAPLRPQKTSPEAVLTSTSKGASVPNEIFNLVKSIVGAGVLGLPAGTLLAHFMILWNLVRP